MATIQKSWAAITWLNQRSWQLSWTKTLRGQTLGIVAATGTQHQIRNFSSTETTMPKIRPIVLSGPSGSGKSTLIKKLMGDYPNKFGFSVSHTTRNPRQGEVDGKDYHFTNKVDMKQEIEKGHFIEHAEFNNNMYGTSKKAVQDVLDQGRICILDIDMQGVISVKKTDLDCLLLFVKPSSFEELERRLRGRGTETEDSIQRRLNTSKKEFEYASIPGNYHHVVVNDQLEKAYEDLKGIITKEITSLS